MKLLPTLKFNHRTLNPNPILSFSLIPSAAMSMSSPTVAVKLVGEYAKCGRSSFKKCLKAIAASVLWFGLVSKDPRGFDMTKWHHLNCVPFGASGVVSFTDAITGFSPLKGSNQLAVKKLVSEGALASEVLIDSLLKDKSLFPGTC